MKIVKIDECATNKYIQHTTSKNKITFDDELMYNLEKYERDDGNHIDVCMDKYGNLVSGVIPCLAEVFIAQIDIPPREYTFTEDGKDEDGNTIQKKVITPFCMDNVTLTLWPLTGV